MHNILNIALLISVVLSLWIGIIIAKRISIPITNSIKVTREISKGNLKNRVVVKSRMIELNELSKAVNVLAQNLLEQENIRKRIVSDVAHELRTPLTAIQIHMEALVDGVCNPTKARLEGIHKEILRVNRLVGDLTKLAKYQNKQEKLVIEQFNLKDLIERIITTFEFEIQTKTFVGKDYKPWTKVHEFGPIGRSHRVLGWKSRRIYQLFSDLEYYHFLITQFEDNVVMATDAVVTIKENNKKKILLDL